MTLKKILLLFIICAVTAVLPQNVYAQNNAYGPRRDPADRMVNLEKTLAQQDVAGWQPVKIFDKEIPQVLEVALGFIVPGLPQLLRNQWRSYGYFAVEATGIGSLIVLQRQGNERRERFKVLAQVPRSNYTYPGYRDNAEEIADPLPIGFGEYYEDMIKWPSSGDFDNDPTISGVQPETDPRTYNGHQWEIAKINNYSGTFGGLPVPVNEAEEQAAMQAYLEAVYPMEYNWDWTGLDSQYDEYHHWFYHSEDAYRKRSTFKTLLVANHLVSGIDMLIQWRINTSKAMQSQNLELKLEGTQVANSAGVVSARQNLSLHKSF